MARYYALAERPWIDDATGGYWGLPPGTIGSVDLAPIGGTSYLFATSDSPFDPSDVSVSIGDGTRLDEYSPSTKERSALVDRLGVSWVAGWKLIDWLWDVLTVDADPDGELRCKPIMPTHRGVLELHLGGHSLIRSRRLPRDPATDPAWPVIQRVLQNDYRAIREAAKRDPRLGDREPTLHRKCLGAMQGKYRLSPEAARDLIGDRRDGLPLHPTTTITDDFDRANQTGLGSSSEGWSWDTFLGGFEIASNLARQISNTRCRAAAQIDLSSDDQVAQVEAVFNGLDSREDVGALVRKDSSSTATFYAATCYQNDVLLKSIDNTLSNLGSTGSDLADGDVLRIEANGSSLTYKRNGVTTITATDTAITGHLRCGIYGYWLGADINNFIAEDLVTGGPTPASASTNTAGTQLTVVMSEATDEDDATGWTLNVDASEPTLTKASGDGTTTHTWTIGTTVTAGQTLTLDYDDTVGNAAATTGGAPVESFNDFEVTNNVPDGPSLPILMHHYRQLARA